MYLFWNLSTYLIFENYVKFLLQIEALHLLNLVSFAQILLE